MPIAVTRAVSRAITRCELTHLDRVEIDVAVARAQHEAYCATLERLGCELVRLPEEPELPDSVFVEDTALVFDELAVLTRPGAASRRPEVDSVGAALESLRPIVRIGGPGILDGGDVIVIERDVYVGLSSRSDQAGIEELGRLLAPYGYRVHGVELRDCLHLKTAACWIGGNTVLANPEWIDPSVLGERSVIEIDPAEPFSANAFPVAGTLVHADSFPATRGRLEAAGFAVAPVPASELAKAEGGVTCCSLILRRPSSPDPPPDRIR